MSLITISKVKKVAPLLVLILIIPLIKTSLNLDEGLLIRFIGLQMVNLLLLITLISEKRKLSIVVSHPLVFVYFLFVLYAGIRLLFGNTNGDNLFDWIKISSYFILLFLLIQIYTYDYLKSIIPFMISILGIIISILGLIELISHMHLGLFKIPLSTYQIDTVFGHRNLYAQVLFMTLSFQIYCATVLSSKVLKLLLSASISINLFLLIILSNRATWLALLMGFILIGILEYWRRRETKYHLSIDKKHLRHTIFSLIVGITFSLVFFSFFTETNEAQNHLKEIIKLENGSGKDRVELWKRTFNIIKENPIIGCGGANWKIEMLKFGNKGLVSEDNITFYQRPHNDFLWITSEFGLIGGLLYLLIFVMAIYILIKRIISKSRKETLFYYALLFWVIGFIIYSFFSFPHERVVQNIILSIFLATIILGDSNFTQKITLYNGWVINIINTICILIILSSIFIGYQRFVSESHVKEALYAKSMNNQSLVISEIISAASYFYPMDPTSTPLSWYRGLAWYQLGNIDSALVYFSEAYELNPYHIHVLNNLATTYTQKERIEEAIVFYNKAITIYPKFDEALLNLCALYYNQGQIDNAYYTLRQVDNDSRNTKYKTFLKAVLKSLITKLLEESGEQKMINSLPNDDEWYYMIHIKSKSNNIPIKDIIFEDEAYNKPK